MKLVMLGGTFNPPHNGHIRMAELVRLQLGYDRVVLVPSYQPAHKTVDSGATAGQRLEMVRLAASRLPSAFVSDCELHRKGVSYSIDTVRYLKKLYRPEGKPGLIIGDDLIAGFHRWHKVDELVREADVIVVHRGEPEELNLPFPHCYVDNPLLPVSSSEIREALRAGRSVDDLLPPAVLDYIGRNRLYV